MCVSFSTYCSMGSMRVMCRSGLCYVRTSFNHADTLDCLVSYFLLPYTKAHVQYDLAAFSCTIQSGGFFLYNIHLRATHTMILSTRGVQIPIDLVSSATDSIRQCVVLFKPVRIQTSDPKSEFLCQSSLYCAELLRLP